MILQRLPIEEYAAIFGKKGRFAYSGADFAALNAENALDVLCICGFYQSGRPLMGIIVGRTSSGWKCPFSAPFSAPDCIGEPSLGTIYDFFTELTDFLGAPLTLTLPPQLHHDNFLTKTCGTLNSLCQKRVDDFNFHFPLPLSPSALQARMASAARRNLRRAHKDGLQLSATSDAARVYSIIAEHHRAKGYHMAMTSEQVIATAEVVPTDYFLVSDGTSDIAAAYIHHVSADTAQLINWGDLPGHELSRPMNFMAYELAMYYSAAGLRVFDLGPASTAGIPNAGLCRFKEDVGCDITTKPTFVI